MYQVYFMLVILSRYINTVHACHYAVNLLCQTMQGRLGFNLVYSFRQCVIL